MELVLYYKPTCPFCVRVLAYAQEAGIAFDLKNIDESQAAVDELVAQGGKRQVPYLLDTQRGVGMYESDDIIEYLKNTNHAH